MQDAIYGNKLLAVGIFKVINAVINNLGIEPFNIYDSKEIFPMKWKIDFTQL